MENMLFNEDDIHLLKTYQATFASEKDSIRNQLIVLKFLTNFIKYIDLC